MEFLEVPTFSFAPSRELTMVNNSAETVEVVVNDRNLRPRVLNGYGLAPYEGTQGIPDGLVEVDVIHMMTDNPERKKGIMYLQLIRIVSG